MSIFFIALWSEYGVDITGKLTQDNPFISIISIKKIILCVNDKLTAIRDKMCYGKQFLQYDKILLNAFCINTNKNAFDCGKTWIVGIIRVNEYGFYE